MADESTLLSSDAGTPASGAVSSTPSPDTSSAVSDTDTRAIAASMLADDAAGETPAAPPPAESADPSTPPVAAISDDDDAAYQALLASGSMPVDRHKAVLTNARNKTRAEVEAEYQRKYGWVDGLKADQSRVQNALGLVGALDTNPEATIRSLAAALGVSLAPPVAQAPAEPEGPPPPDVRLDDGSEFYSAKQLAKLNAWKDQQLEQRFAQFAKRYDPLVQRQVETEMRAQAHAEAGDLLATCRKEWPQFPALEADIKQRMAADPTLSLDRAYIQAFSAKGLPSLQQHWESDRASQLSRKAAASAAPPSSL